MISETNNALQVAGFAVGPLATNCYIVSETVSGKGIIIDPGAHDARIGEHIKSTGVDILNIVNTHGHADHIAGNAELGFPVMIHALDALCLSDPARNLSMFSGEDCSPVTAVRTLEDGDRIAVGGLELEVIHTPGHTPGGISLRCGDILFSGDTLFFEGVGRTDLPGGDTARLAKSIRERLLTLPDHVIVYPGHGPATTIGHEKFYESTY